MDGLATSQLCAMWTHESFVVRVRDMVTGKVLHLDYYSSRSIASEKHRAYLRRYSGKQVCVSMFNRVPIEEY